MSGPAGKIMISEQYMRIWYFLEVIDGSGVKIMFFCHIFSPL